ncbi:MAG: alpha/beta fold hydrolase [Nitrospinaceae bacterium]|jgi:pimeloyl-ACP methyl ester carboxylesterase|nr:alpha/beta fold hydrolase [Nitrospinaceae bacterium]MBT3433503.1 alpha/beta fold hydrolase [Nitrospinaceae bacterium]MBT3822532.1 alpha/beta fold hydrolase [Nitrospinaceae bacterium]MBT4429901.1 alpha/beta fold hydrolase [Nitrospinaceae bacterium]MBT5367194.1 alpha/beta fold hydrolase [Nitrospinaceae bacterium]
MTKVTRKIICEDHMIDALDGSLKLHLREKRLKGLGKRSEGALLCVHGQSIPSTVAFDFPVPGYSWMDYAARRGFDVFALSLRGFGPSTRPPEMLANPKGAPPAVRAKEAFRDVVAAVRFIREQSETEKVNLLGWAQGTMLSCAFAAAYPKEAGRLALISPLYLCDEPGSFSLFEDPKKPGELNPVFFGGAWRWVTQKGQLHNWNRLIPKGQHGRWREARAVRAYWSEQLRHDPGGARRRVPAVKVPNGLMADHYDRTQGLAFFDAAKVKSPALLVRMECDLVSKDPEAQGLFRAMTKSPGKRYVILGGATHFAQFEKRREDLFSEVQGFLES